MSMKKQVSIHGRRAYLDTNDKLVGRKGLASGGEDKPTVVHPSWAYAAFIDDFYGDTGAENWVRNVADTGAANNSALGIHHSATNGLFSMFSPSGGSDPTLYNASINSNKRWKANQGELRLTARVKMPTITGIQAYIGFTDDTGTAEFPIFEDTAGTPGKNSIAGDAAGWLFSTANSRTTWQGVGVAGGTDATALVTSNAPTANVYDLLEIVLDTGGDATFFLNGLAKGVVTDAVTPTTAIFPVAAVAPQVSNAGRTLDVDLVAVSALRDTGT